MNKELYVSPALVTFENFSELLETLDEYIDAHSKTIARYEDKLGVLLRSANGGDSKQGMMRFDQEDSTANVENSQAQEVQPSQKRRRSPSSEGGEQGWLVLEADETSIRVASGSASSTNGKQIEALFKIIESLKAKLASLQVSRKLVSDLPSQGFSQDQKIVVMFRDGLPRQIIPSYEVTRVVKKFRYSEQFDIQVLT